MKVVLLYIVFQCSMIFYATALFGQIISTDAGGGGSTSDGVLATTENIGYIEGIAVDSKGNLFLADGNHNKIRKVDTFGIITTIAGTGSTGFSGDSGLAISAKLNVPNYVAVDINDNIYFTDLNNNRIRKVDAVTSIITTVAGNGVPTFSGDGFAATSASINDPQGITLDTHGNLFIADQGNQRIRKVDTSGIITTFAGSGSIGFSGDGGLADTARFNGPKYVCTDTAGDLFIIDGNGRVRMVNATTHIISTIAGNGTIPYVTDGVPATAAPMDPWAVILNSSGNIFISDHTNNRIRMIDNSGLIHTVVGNGISGFFGDAGTATGAEIHFPQGLAFDPCGNLYIADNQNKRVRKVTYPPTPITLTNTLSASPTDTICAGTPVTFTTAATTSSGTITYQWYVNGSSVSTTGSSYTYTPANGDSIRCVATAANACTSAITSSNTINMVVDNYTASSVSITTPAVAVVGSTVTVNATVTPPGISSYSIKWFNNGSLFNTTTVPTVTYTKAAGTDHITARLIPSGCYDSSTSSVDSVTTNTTETSPQPSPKEREVLRTYPNPVHGSLTLSISDGKEIAHVDVCNLLGQVVVSGDHHAHQININTAALLPGVYVVKVTDSEGGKMITRIVKE